LRCVSRSIRRRAHDREFAAGPAGLGLVTIFWDVYFGTAGKLFDSATGKMTDPAYSRRVEKFLNELVWMARALRHARESLPAD
jgi:sterol desaturase/sphingolipid hydroxylase (fatty acid hydroxylase superfamily)